MNREHIPDLPVTVGRVDGAGAIVGFLSIEAAETYVATFLMAQDPAGVEAGDYYVDAPEPASSDVDAYDSRDPKSPGYHGRMADYADMARKRAKGE